MSHKKWIVRDADKNKASEISEKFNIDPFVAYLMVSRGIVSDVEVSMFLSDNCFLTSPLDFADMDEAVFAVGEAIDVGDKICIYGDYDCDGVTSTALLFDFLRNEGADVMYYIPSRLDEGYGLNNDAVDKLCAQGVNLIVTVDNGITAFDEAEHIYELGMRLVVTDHHRLSGDRLPRAEAVVNPHRSDNNLKFADYCGVGVAFKLACAMYDGDTDDLRQRYLDLVAIGTVADMVPLKDENRNFVRLGLEQINKNPRPAIRSFMMRNGEKQYTSTDITFQLCPKINAVGRMDDAKDAVEFLLSDSVDGAEVLYSRLIEENTKRQEEEQRVIDEIREIIAKNPKLVSDRVIVLAGKNFHTGIIGIVAAKVLGIYGKPAFVISVSDDGTAHGSARSIEGFDIFDAVSACAENLIQFGGHPMAAGVTLYTDRIDDFRKAINAYARKNFPVMPHGEIVIDCKVSPHYLTENLVDNIASLEPFGTDNPQPVFGVMNLRLLGITPLKDNKHIRLELEKKGKRIRVVKFGTSPDEFPYRPGDILNLAVKVSKNFYNGKNYVSVQAVDIRLASADDEKYFSEKEKYETYRITGKGDSTLYPDRDTCVLVYKFLKKNGGWSYDLDELYFRLCQRVTYGALMYAIKAFVQCKLIKYNKTITLSDTDGKVDLENCEILKTLKGRLRLG